MKEEGQVLIHTANTWGEKTMTNTSSEGREVIREELQMLQTDWEQMLSQVLSMFINCLKCFSIFILKILGKVVEYSKNIMTFYGIVLICLFLSSVVFVFQVTDTKVMLESCLLQWTDFSASHNQIIRWLKDMEKRLRETHLKADLSEKKAELQRCKVKEICVCVCAFLFALFCVSHCMCMGIFMLHTDECTYSLVLII